MIGDKRKRKKARAAFTLIELIVATGLFVLVTTAILEVYMQTTRYGRQVVLRAKTQDKVRGVLEAVARAVRVSNFDYAAYGGALPAQPTSILRILNPNESDYFYSRPSWTIRKDDNMDTWCGSPPCAIQGIRDNYSVNLFQSDVQLEDLRFYMSPSQDPFDFNPITGTYPSDEQPLVTIYMRVRGLADRPSDQWVLSLQTTVTPRLYLR